MGNGRSAPPARRSSTSEADLRWDAFLGPVLGFTGHTWFLYQIEKTNPDLVPLLFTAKGDYAATKAALYASAAALNTELAQLGRTISLLRSVDVRYVPSISPFNLSGITGWQQGAGGDPYLSGIAATGGNQRDAALGFFRDDCDEPYVILQNVGHPSADFPNSSASPSSFRIELDFSAATDPSLDRDALLTLDATTGLSTPLALTGSGNLRSIELSLPPGDPHRLAGRSIPPQGFCTRRMCPDP